MGGCGLMPHCNKFNAPVFIECVQDGIELVTWDPEDVANIFFDEASFQNLAPGHTSHDSTFCGGSQGLMDLLIGEMIIISENLFERLFDASGSSIIPPSIKPSAEERHA
jgi:hypothetical protein